MAFRGNYNEYIVGVVVFPVFALSTYFYDIIVSILSDIFMLLIASHFFISLRIETVKTFSAVA